MLQLWGWLFYSIFSLTQASPDYFTLLNPSNRTTDDPGFALNETIFQVSEELIYNVSYASIDIGQVRVKLLEKNLKDGRTSYHAIAYIDSYKRIPFVNLHAIYESIFDSSIYSTWFRSRKRMDSQSELIVYSFDYPKHRMYIDFGTLETGKMNSRDSLTIDTLCQDGLSLFYFARALLQSHAQPHIPTVVSEKKGNTYINFHGKRSSEEIDAIPYPVDVVHFEGEADFVGIFGLTGAFEGWFSNDAASIPILAKMKVLIGNIRIELMEWKRDGWTPPRYSEEGNK